MFPRTMGMPVRFPHAVHCTAGRCIPIVVGLLLVSGSVHAQQEARGWRVSAAAGAAVPIDDGTWQSGAEPVLRIGIDHRVRGRFVIGAEWIGTWFETSAGDASRHHVSLTAAAYPIGNFFVSAGLGIGLSTRETLVIDPNYCCVAFQDHNSGPGLTASIGYDARVSSRLTLTPIVSAAFMRRGSDTYGFGWFGAKLSVDTR